MKPEERIILFSDKADKVLELAANMEEAFGPGNYHLKLAIMAGLSDMYFLNTKTTER